MVSSSSSDSQVLSSLAEFNNSFPLTWNTSGNEISARVLGYALKWVLAGSPSRGGDVTVYVFYIN